MQDWTLHSDNTGGYFQCNRFMANMKIKDLPTDGSGGLVGDLWSEESGNAHAETLRLREKNKRMARFIHHDTRCAVCRMVARVIDWELEILFNIESFSLALV